jgi:DNA-directed RNA polymerase specialized sigma24 family protein
VREVTSGTDRSTGIADDEGLLSAELRQLGETRADPDFETLHRTYSRRLFKQIIAITRHHADAEDALQDDFHNDYVALPLF